MAWVCLIAIIILSLIRVPSDLPMVISNDKIGHFIAYFVLMSLFMFCYSKHKLLLVIFCSMGILLEILQGQTGYRTYDYNDMFANSVGMSVAWLLSFTRYIKIPHYVERMIMK